MPTFQCYPITNPNANWNYCPSYGAAILFSCLFGLTTIAHVVQAILHKKPFAWVLIMGAVWESGGYIVRILSVEHQLNSTFATVQQLLILLSPLWINAFVYMTLGRMIHFFLPDDKVLGLKAKRITLLFVLCDIASFVVQATGGVMTTPSESVSAQKLGLHIYMGGVGLQLLFIGIFFALCIRFQLKISRQEYSSYKGVHMTDIKSPVQARRLLFLLYLVLGLIVFRNIYRLIEFSAGVYSNITEHEWYTYVFDATPMFFALIAFNAYHPGRILRGPNSDFSESKKIEKAEKQAKKQVKRQDKDAEKREKIVSRLERKKEKEMKKSGGLGVYDKLQDGGSQDFGPGAYENA